MNWDQIAAHVVTCTHWTWSQAMHHCDLPTYFALCDWWRVVPPAAVQLRRIASFIGLKPEAEPGTPRMAEAATSEPANHEQAAASFAMAGFPVFEGRPNDPALDLISNDLF